MLYDLLQTIANLQYSGSGAEGTSSHLASIETFFLLSSILSITYWPCFWDFYTICMGSMVQIHTLIYDRVIFGVFKQMKLDVTICINANCMLTYI